jgi:N-acetylglucosamine-6-phosphate deacetylase
VDVGDDPSHAVPILSEQLPQTGVTAFLPTVISSPAERYEGIFAAYASIGDVSGARPLGLHLEGPLLSPRRCGAHDRAVIEAADPELLGRFHDDGHVRLVTLAPERPGVLACVAPLAARGITGIDAGATMVTHLYNAMSPFEHRSPNTVGVALTDGRVVAGLIPDGIHVHPVGLRLAVQAKGVDRVALVTDMIAAAGMGPGEYPLGNRRVVVDDTSARLPDGTLAGSIVTLDAAVRNMVRWAGTTLAQALHMATAVPARLLGLSSLGRIAAGCDADLVLFDDDLRVQATFVRGECVWSVPSAA